MLLWAMIMSVAFAGAGDTLMARTFGGTDYDFASSIQQTIDGGFAISGTTYSFGNGGGDFYLLKINPFGDTSWTRTYGGNNYEKAVSVRQTIDGGYFLFGETESFGAGMRDFYLVRIKQNGDTIWTRTFGGNNDEYAASAEITADEGCILAGFTNSYGAGGFDVYLVKTDADGNLLWAQTFGGILHDEARSVDLTDGGYIVAGATKNFGASEQDYYLLRIDNDGNEMWSRTFGGYGFESARSVRHTEDGGHIIGGYTDSFGAGSADIYLVKTDSSGAVLWTRVYGGAGLDLAFSVQQTLDNGYIVAGHSIIEGFYGDAFLLKTDNMGYLMWAGFYGGEEQDVAYSVVQSSDGNYIFVGDTNSYGHGLMDMFMVKVIDGQQVICGDVNMAPDTYPLAIPPGGVFGLTGVIGNPTSASVNTDIWVGVWYMGIFLQTAFFDSVPLNPGQYLSAHMTQLVPNYAPAGVYRYVAYCGDRETSTICDSAWFDLNIAGLRMPWGSESWSLQGQWETAPEVPAEYSLLCNYPNPFNASTDISFDLPSAGHLTLVIYNMLGQEVATLADSWMDAGSHKIVWEASSASSGIYFCKMRAGDFVAVRKMSLLK